MARCGGFGWIEAKAEGGSRKGSGEGTHHASSNIRRLVTSSSTRKVLRIRSFFDGEDVDGFDNQLNFVADFQVEVFERFGGQDGSHSGGDGDLEFDERHDFVAGDFGDLGGDVVASSVFHGVLSSIWFLEIVSCYMRKEKFLPEYVKLAARRGQRPRCRRAINAGTVGSLGAVGYFRGPRRGSGNRAEICSAGKSDSSLRNWLCCEIDGALEAWVWLAVDFHPAPNDEVGPLSGFGVEIEVAAFSPFEAVFIEASEPIVRLARGSGVAGGDIHRNPANARREKVRPATVAWIVILTGVFRFQAAAVKEAARNLASATKGDEESVLIGAGVAVAGKAFLGAAESETFYLPACFGVMLALFDDEAVELFRNEHRILFVAGQIVRDFLDIGCYFHILFITTKLGREGATIGVGERPRFCRIGQATDTAAEDFEFSDDLEGFGG